MDVATLIRKLSNKKIRPNAKVLIHKDADEDQEIRQVSIIGNTVYLSNRPETEWNWAGFDPSAEPPDDTWVELIRQHKEKERRRPRVKLHSSQA